MRHKVTIPGDQPNADSGSRNRELSTAAKDTYAGALKASGATSETMERWVADDKRRTNSESAKRAQLTADMRNANNGRRA